MNSELKVKTLPQLKGPAAWNRILPAPSPPIALESDGTADIIIIGAGFAGLSAARRLLQIDNSQEIAVLDADRIAEGSAGRNSGFMIDLPHELTSEDYAGKGDDSSTTKLNRHAISFAADAVEQYQIDRNFFDPSGKINGAASEKAESKNESYANHLKQLSEPFELLDRKRMTAITGSSHYLSGLYTPGTVTLQPAGYIRGLANGLKNQGVRIFENSPVLRITGDGSNWKVSSKDGNLNASKIILTVNGYLESFGFEKNHLMQLFLFAVMTPDLDSESLAKLGGNSRWGITPSDPMGTSLRRIDSLQGGNRIVTRTCAAMRQNMRPSNKDLARAAKVMQRKFEQRFPQLTGLKMEYQWCGHLCLTRNNVSVMEEIERGIFSGCVQNGLGTARGTLTGIGAAEQASGVESMVTDYFQQEPSPKKLPPKPFFQLGANAFIHWKEWLASQE